MVCYRLLVNQKNCRSNLFPIGPYGNWEEVRCNSVARGLKNSIDKAIEVICL